MSDIDLKAAERLFNDKHECSPAVFRTGTALLAALAASLVREEEATELLRWAFDCPDPFHAETHETTPKEGR